MRVTNVKAASRIAIITILTGTLVACGRSEPEPGAMESLASSDPGTDSADPVEQNVLLAEWAGPYGGVPAFDRMTVEAIRPALEAAMSERLAEIGAIAANPEPPTFANTIEAYEKTGHTYDRVSVYYSVMGSNLSTPEFREVQREMEPRLAEYRTQIIQNEALFDRIRAVYESEEMDGLRPDQQRLVWLIHNSFASQGASLDAEGKTRYAEINNRLAELTTRFANNVLADEEKYVVYLEEDQLSGLPGSFIEAAAAAAASRGEENRYAVTNTRSSMDPFLTYSDERDLREQVWRNYYSRGDNGDENDNNALIAEILQLRDERVALLGYDNFAEWQTENRMAKEPARAMELMLTIWPAAIARVEEEVAEMQAVADAEGAELTIEPWDYRYYAEKVRKAKYDLDSDAVKQYMQLDR
ncbi:MAG: M3 family metallopeptidase, partial [Xanthomonadales bacterium]|nr:M3 family metallopeptidase [Xanthomonadales bacterium]